MQRHTSVGYSTYGTRQPQRRLYSHPIQKLSRPHVKYKAFSLFLLHATWSSVKTSTQKKNTRVKKTYCYFILIYLIYLYISFLLPPCSPCSLQLTAGHRGQLVHFSTWQEGKSTSKQLLERAGAPEGPPKQAKSGETSAVQTWTLWAPWPDSVHVLNLFTLCGQSFTHSFVPTFIYMKMAE